MEYRKCRRSKRRLLRLKNIATKKDAALLPVKARICLKEKHEHQTEVPGGQGLPRTWSRAGGCLMTCFQSVLLETRGAWRDTLSGWLHVPTFIPEWRWGPSGLKFYDTMKTVDFTQASTSDTGKPSALTSWIKHKQDTSSGIGLKSSHHYWSLLFHGLH